jgi:C1A family cysteine protease
MRSSLVENGPFALGLNWDKSWFKGGTLDVPRKKDVQGGHMVCVVGWDGTSFKVRNSWGKWWGNGGYAWITERAVEWGEARAWALYDSSSL